jgi:hypothetical protein
MKKFVRLKNLFGAGGSIPVGRTKFIRDYVYQPGGPEFVPGTSVRRLRLIDLGERAKAAISDEVDELVEGLRRERDAKLNIIIEAA